MKRCLYCYQLLTANEKDFHAACSKKIFGQDLAPELTFTETEMKVLATQVIKTHHTVTGVQPKLSLEIAKEKTLSKNPKRFNIVNLWGGYILKPPTTQYPYLPEVEDLTMHLASLAKIKVVPHSLIKLGSGNMAYITKRIDRMKNVKIHMEDMCQLTERITEDKYHGSYEQIGKTILKYSASPGLDLVDFFEQVLFCFLTGNADMHLKNFSIIHDPKRGPLLAPAYDLVSTVIVNPADKEDLALTLNGKRKKINQTDFEIAFNTLNLEPKQQANIFRKMEISTESWLRFIEISFLPNELKLNYQSVIKEKMYQLFNS
jgi:serine/threonine-protein kinase HipA